MMEIPKFNEGFTKIADNVLFLDKSYFLDGQINNIDQQRKKFDENVKIFDSKLKNVKSVASKKKPESKPKNKIDSSEKIPSEIILHKIQNKRKAYKKILFDSNKDIGDIQLKYLEYEHQMKRAENDMMKVFENPVLEHKLQANENAINIIFAEQEYFRILKNFYSKNEYTDIRNISEADLDKIKEFVVQNSEKQLNEQVRPEEYPSFGNQNGK